MSFWVAGAAVVGAAATAGATIYTANSQAEAAKKASESQSDAAQAGIAEQRRQFDQIQSLLAPYVQSGNAAMSAQNDLNGINGPEAQKRAIDQLQNSPQFKSLVSQGENSILQNAAATGGLRGGNTQAALAQFRPAMLSQLINDQYSRLGAQTQLGQASAAGQAASGQQNANSVSALLQQQGAAQAGGALAQGAQQGQIASALAGGIGTLSGINWGNLFGGTPSPTQGGQTVSPTTTPQG